MGEEKTTSTRVAPLLNPYQEFSLCILNKAFCKYFIANKDGTYNQTATYHNYFLADEPELHEMRSSLVAITSVLCSTALLGLIGQMLVLWIYWRRLRVGPASYLIIAVATVDLLVCAIVIPLRVAREWGTRLHSEVGCKMVELLQHQTVMVSLSLLTAIALERYWCITKAPKQLFSNKGAKIYIGLSIFISTLLAFPWGVAVTSVYLAPEHRGYCIPTNAFIPFNTLKTYAYFHSILLLLMAFIATTTYSFTLSFIQRQSLEIKLYAKRRGEWIRKRDKPRYSESESSDTSADTESSDAPQIELQTRSTSVPDVPNGRLSTEHNGNEPVQTQLKDEQSAAAIESGQSGSDAEASPQPHPAAEVTWERAGAGNGLEPDTLPIMQVPYHDEPHEALETPEAAAAEDRCNSEEGNQRSSEEDDYREHRRPYRHRRRFHRNPWHRLKTRTATTLFCVTILFIVCHVPSVLMNFRVLPMVPAVYYLYLLPHTLSWFVYMIMNKHFREQAGFVCGFR